MPAPQTWAEMRTMMERLLVQRSGADVGDWNMRIAAENPASEDALRAWLTDRGVTGYAQMMLVMETFGYPDFLTASADELLDGQYADRPALRPVLDALLAFAATLESVTVQARKTYVTLVTPRRQFALIRPTTRTRVDLGLRLAGAGPGGKLLAAGSLGNDVITVRIPLASVDDIDSDVEELLLRARAESL
jgi:hypothetical protein